MRDIIDQNLNQAASFLKSRLAAGRNLCDLKTWYQRNHSLDYRDEVIQSVYVLRYFAAYLAEYYLAFRNMFENPHCPERIDVFSIGCGCGPDLHALKMASHEFRIFYRYTGIDLIYWRFRPTNPQARFFKYDVRKLHVKHIEDRTIFVLPKSLIEMNNYQFNSLCRVFESVKFKYPQIVLYNSSPTRVNDRLETLISAITDNNFRIVDRVSFDKMKQMSFCKLVRDCSNRQWRIQNRLVNMMDELDTFCPYRRGCPEKCDELRRQPMMEFDSSRMFDDIIFFERRD